ncbi:transporter [Parazoarcus communis]|uniref:Transporter n=1 Tax=Parazoarcus communis SWub3 = DSM 12120 TaxID=1121029 RepID=A0A323UQA2_9RHOO|nr:transporter [Parazoarcus communis]NMG72216.1 transporter [Parazoarcus communis SWub3 = DSM 12120]PZA14855.1 transporter [Azoarcus communis] [Parazoarcus communis SWub3 = DSM 12120]
MKKIAVQVSAVSSYPRLAARVCHGAKKRSGRIIAGFLLLFMSPLVLAVSVDAGDYDYVPAGTQLGLLYYQYSSGDSLYAGGRKVSDDARARAQVGILRVVKYLDVGGVTVAPQVLLPFGAVQTAGDLDGASVRNGMGDLILASTVFLYKDDQRRVLGITPWLWLPTGQYDRSRTLNPFGENRWKFALQVAGVLPLGESVTLDLVGDVQFYGDNRDFGPSGQILSQRHSWDSQAHLRYHLSAATAFSVSISQLNGGETELDGVRQNDRQRRSRVSVGASHFLTSGWQILGTLGKDLSVENGVREDVRMNLRLLYVF